MTTRPDRLPEPAPDLQGALDALLNDPVAVRTRPSGDPHGWQADLERELRSMSERARDLAPALQQVVGTGENRLFAVEAGATGRLLGLRIRPGARGRRAEEWTEAFAQAYADARQDATTQVDELLAGTGLQPDAEANPQLARATEDGRDGHG